MHRVAAGVPEAVDPAVLIAAVDDLLRALGDGRAVNPPRSEHVGRPGDPAHFALRMPARFPQLGLSGCKRLDEPGGGGPRTSVIELRLPDGREVAMDAEHLTNLRSAAAAVWAVRYLAPRGVQRLAVIGTGRIARWVARAAAQVLAPDVVVATSRSAERREAFAADLQGCLPCRLELAPTPEAAGRGAEAVIAACPARTPVLTPQSVGVDATAVAVEGDPRVCQLDPRLLAAPRVLVVDQPEQAQRSGSWLAARAAGLTLTPHGLGEVACGRVQVPSGSHGAVVLLTGLAVLDVGLAWEVWSRQPRDGAVAE